MTKEEEDSKGEVVSKGEKKKISVLKKNQEFIPYSRGDAART
jgi:hypothetical protein